MSKRFRRVVERARSEGLHVTLVVTSFEPQLGDRLTMTALSTTEDHGDLGSLLDDIEAYVDAKVATDSIEPVLDVFERRWGSVA